VYTFHTDRHYYTQTVSPLTAHQNTRLQS